MIDFESAPQTTLTDKLVSMGIDLPPADSLSDEALSTKLWDIITQLGQLRIYLHNTNHLSDRELYTLLCGRPVP